MITFKPNPGKQTFALQQPRYIKEILYGGARGGGKTFAGMMWLTKYIHHPRFQGLVIRRNSDDLSDWVERARYMYTGLGAIISGNPAVIRFPSGAIIRTGHLKDDQTYTKYQGHEYQMMLLEELTQIATKERYMKLTTSCRTTVPELQPQIFSTANPGGIGHLWVKDLFIDPHSANKSFVGEDGIRRIYIPATIDDNPHLMDNDPEYVQRLEALKYTDEALYRAWRFGDWDIFVGQVFGEWRVGKHVIDKLPVEPKVFATWTKYIGFDWGYRDPASAHWIAVSPENDVGVKHYYIYREVYETEKRPSWWAKEIASIVKDEPIDSLIMPHDTYSNLGGSRPIKAQFEEVFDEMKINLTMVSGEAKSHRAKINRQALLHDGLSVSPDGFPYIQILQHCRNLIRTIPALPYSESHPEEIDDKAEDHAYDSLTYGLYRILGGESMIVTSKQMTKRRESFIINDKGHAEGLAVDINKALQQSSQDYRDWRHI